MSIFNIFPHRNDISNQLIQSTSFYTLYSNDEIFYFKYNDKKIGKHVYNLLKTVKNRNVLDVVYKDGTLRCTAILPLQKVISNEHLSESYKEYILETVRKTVIFIHEKCNIVHNNLREESIFINKKTGEIILGGFEKAQPGEHGTDQDQLNELAVYLLQREIDGAHLSDENFYTNFYEQIQMLPVMSESALVGFLNLVRNEQKKGNMISIVRNYIAETLIKRFITLNSGVQAVPGDLKKLEMAVQQGEIHYDSLKNRPTANTKNSEGINCLMRYIIFFYIVLLDIEDYTLYLKEFVTLMDTRFRLEVLSKQEFFIGKRVDWRNKAIFDNISIGLRCKDERLQYQTVQLFNNTFPCYKKSQIKESIRLLSFCRIPIVLRLLKNHFSLFAENDLKGLFKLFFVFLEEPVLRKDSIILLTGEFKVFEPKKLCTNLLPFLCELIIQEPLDELFDLIRTILNHLQVNKEELQENEIKSRVKKWLPFLSKKQVGNGNKNKMKSNKSTNLDNKNDTTNYPKDTESEKTNETEDLSFYKDKDKWEDDW